MPNPGQWDMGMSHGDLALPAWQKNHTEAVLRGGYRMFYCVSMWEQQLFLQSTSPRKGGGTSSITPSRCWRSGAEQSHAHRARGGCRGGRAAAWRLIHLPGCQSINQRIQQSGTGWDNMDLRKICVHTTSTQDGSN